MSVWKRSERVSLIKSAAVFSAVSICFSIVSSTIQLNFVGVNDASDTAPIGFVAGSLFKKIEIKNKENQSINTN